MKIINARNVHEALPEALRYLFSTGVPRDTRNGEVLVAPEPVATVYSHPRERVLFWPERDANPFFHFYEALWMLGGRNDVASLTRFVARMAEFSDDGQTLHGAYGARWRDHFASPGVPAFSDQLQAIYKALRKDPTCRRQVLQIWDPDEDLWGQEGKRDIPCNLTATFQISEFGSLDMVVFNRSNDVVWGCYGANAVHFSMLQEWMAFATRTRVGTYTHVSVNWHGYRNTVEPLASLADRAADPPYSRPTSPYTDPGLVPFPLVTYPPDIWDQDLQMFLDHEGRAMGYRDPFFRRVAIPMMATHDAFREYRGRSRYEAALDKATEIQAPDWRLAVEEWLTRRLGRWGEKHA